MLTAVAFEEFPKIARISRDCVITEKIDGTNAQIYIDDEGMVWAGSRSQWLTVEKDNFGFARWVSEHTDALREELGFGRHYGEWWGSGIQRRYGLNEKRFSLFNVHRWQQENLELCHVVPTLYKGPFDTTVIQQWLLNLTLTGSYAAPGFMKPEGIVIFHTAGSVLFKKTIEKDEQPKGRAVL